jgi:hypothetical protein
MWMPMQPNYKISKDKSQLRFQPRSEIKEAKGTKTKKTKEKQKNVKQNSVFNLQTDYYLSFMIVLII